MWVRIPLGVWMSVSCECCVLSGRGLCDELITRPEEFYRLWYFVMCDIGTSWMRRAWPTGRVVAPKININSVFSCDYLLSLLYFRLLLVYFSYVHVLSLQLALWLSFQHMNNKKLNLNWNKYNYSKTCLKRNAIVPVFVFRFHRFPFYKGLCFNP